MKEDELTKQIRETELPEIELKSHRSRLKMALLEAGCPTNRGREKQPAAENILQGGVKIMLKGLNAKQPVWKILTGAVAAAVVLALAVMLPSMLGESPEARAANIAKESPEVKAALNTDNGTVTKVLKVTDDAGVTKYLVAMQGDTGAVPVLVDLDSKQVITIQSPDFTDVQKEQAIAIAKADPRIQELLAKGGQLNFEYGFCALDMTSLVFEQYGEISVWSQDFKCSAEVALNAGAVVKYYVWENDPNAPDSNGNMPEKTITPPGTTTPPEVTISVISGESGTVTPAP